MIRIIINKIMITAQHNEPASPVLVASLDEEVLDDPLSLKLVLKFVAINLLPQFPQNIATSLFSCPQFEQIFDIFYPLIIK